MANFNTVVTFNPTKGVKRNPTPRILKAQFGDGYLQRTVDGINSIEENWSLSFINRNSTEADILVGFLEDRKGVEAFDWPPPSSSSSIRVYCPKWDISLVANNTKSISCTFTKVFEP